MILSRHVLLKAYRCSSFDRYSCAKHSILSLDNRSNSRANEMEWCFPCNPKVFFSTTCSKHLNWASFWTSTEALERWIELDCCQRRISRNVSTLVVDTYKNTDLIWLVLYAVSIFLSLSTGDGNAFVSRRVHPFFRCLFLHKHISFSGCVVFLGKEVGHYLKPINNLLILSFLSLKSLWMTEKYWFQNEFL